MTGAIFLANKKDNEEQKAKKMPLIIITIILILILLFTGGYFIWQNISNKRADNSYEKLTTLRDDKNSGNDNTTTLADNPIDFKSLKNINTDVYAWINVPNTKVDYPVAQSPTDDSYYLHHTIYKKYEFAGTIYSEFCNKKDFSDRVTVLYGHNMQKEMMFTSLHRFENKDFFDENQYFTVYTDGHILTYKIISAFVYDNRHIMNSFDFNDDEIFEEFLSTLQNPRSMVQNVREDIELTKENKILVLSTCLNKDKSKRYLVNGVLINDEPTK